MSAAVPPMPSEAAQPGLSEPLRIINAFIAPSKTFEDIRRNASWWAPFVLSAIIATGFFFTVEKKVGWDAVVRDVVASNSSFQQASPDVQERQLNIMAKGYKYSSEYGAAIFILVFVLLQAVILMVAFNFALEAALPFKTVVSVVLYGSLPYAISNLLGIVSLMVGTGENFYFPNPVASNPAYFMDHTATSKFWYTMATSLDIFTIWVIVLVGMGLALNSARKKVKVSTGIWTVAVLYFLWKLATAALAGLRG